VLLDCQIQNDHLARLGAVEIPEREYLRRLEHALSLDRSFV
jgi:leucyl/phenylalanyl-tRNA--protein transferase